MQEEKIEGVKVEATVPKEKKTAKSRKPKEQSPVELQGIFPHEGFVNPYGFIHLSGKVAEAFGALKGTKTTISIDFKEGNMIISKV